MSAAGNVSWVWEIFSWEQLASVLTVFSLSVGAVIPVMNIFRKKREDELKKEDDEKVSRVTEIVQKELKSLRERLDKEISKVQEIFLKQEVRDKDIRANTDAIHALEREFSQYRDRQDTINDRINYMDGFMKSQNYSYRKYIDKNNNNKTEE